MILEYNKIPTVLLLGNGINRAYDFSSWEELIKSIGTKELSKEEKQSLKTVPYPLQPVILTDDHLGEQMKMVSGPLAGIRAPEEEEELLQKYANLPVDAVLTSNYTYELEKAIEPIFQCSVGRKCRWRHLACDKDGKFCREQLHTYFLPEEGGPSIWHIHGEAARPNTMILGYYYYGKLLSKLQQNISQLIKRYKASQVRKFNLEIHSWLDYFMLGDVYIVGCGMALSELDLWWLVNCKKRNFPDWKTILFKPDIRMEERLLAEAYDVEVIQNEVGASYREYYRQTVGNLKRRITGLSG